MSGRPRRPESRFTDSHGYVQVRVGDVWVPEHRLVMMGMLGRELVRGESVHHHNGRRDDNRPVGRIEGRAPRLEAVRADELARLGASTRCADRMPVELVEARLRAGTWEARPRAASGFPESVRKPVAVALSYVAHPRRRLRVSPDQLSIFDAIGAETLEEAS